MKLHFLPRAALLCALCLNGLACATTNAQQIPPRSNLTGPLQIGFDNQGLQTLSYSGANLSDAAKFGQETFSVRGVTRLDAEGKISDMPSADPRRSWNGATQTLTLNYDWGAVRCHYLPLPDRLDMDITVENRSQQTLAGLNIFPLAVRFDAFPAGYDADTPHINFNYDGPSVQHAEFGAGTLTLVNRDVDKTLAVGLLSTSETRKTFRYDVYVGSTPLWYQPTFWPKWTRPIAPGARDLYRISLRFSPAHSDSYAVAADVYRKFAATYPFQVKWDDRRPIGALFLSSASDNHPAHNPRGWFNNNADVDVTTLAGRADLKKRLMRFADESIAELQMVGAQGMITWDIEGQEYPHAISYIGDPRLVGQLAPEMEPLADAYFQKFRDAGLQVGLCVRPQQLVVKANGKADQNAVSDPAQQLIDKIRYARKRWGCTLFYVDSNGGPADPSDATIFQRVADAVPGVLLMPEHQNFKYQAYTAPYNDLRFESSITPADVRRTYPRAFSVMKGEMPQLTKRHDELVQAVRAGDILVFNGWYDSDEGRAVKGIYEEAGR